MAIFSRFGETVDVVRVAELVDVERYEFRDPDERDRECVDAGEYLVIAYDDGAQDITHRGYLRADGGAHEIAEAIRYATGGAR